MYKNITSYKLSETDMTIGCVIRGFSLRELSLILTGVQVTVSCLVAAASSQFVDPQNAKILKEQRFDAGDGRFGSAFAQEDGTVFREETTADGERIGQYSYIDQDGQTITVRYTAGKDGFRILEGLSQFYRGSLSMSSLSKLRSSCTSWSQRPDISSS